MKQNLLKEAIPYANNKFLGLFRIRLWLYTHVEPKRDKGFRHWLKYKVGEEPVYSNESDYRQSTVRMEQYLQNHGYLTPDVQYNTKREEHQVDVTYTVYTKKQYIIHQIYLPSDSSEISRVIQKHKKELDVKPGQAYRVGSLDAERDKFATLIRSEGYFDFSKEYIYYFIDTALGNFKLDVYFRVKDPSDSTRHSKYFIDDITVYPVYSIDTTIDTAHFDTLTRKEYTIIQPELFLKRRTIARNILIRKGEVFSQKHHNYTVNHFLDLGIFKFVNINYEKDGDDSLDMVIQLTPSNTQNVVGELNVSTTTSNFLGWGASLSYINQNLFRGAEKLTVSGSVNAETQLNSDQTFLNTLELRGRVELGFPRLLVPLNASKVTTYYVPRTKFGLSENYQKRIEYYTLNSFLFDYAYDWRRRTKIQHILTPLSVNDVRLLNSTSEFNDILDNNPILREGFEDVFIISMQYSFIYTGTQKERGAGYGYFRGNLDLAGNVLYPIASAFNAGPTPYYIFGRPFANYTRVDGDGRYYLSIGKNQTLANRIVAGIAVPYGNSNVTPYIKQFFIGGATSVRAFRLRALGPGSYASPDDASENVFFPDQTGDIKLELNTEYRFPIVSFLKGALFADAGNVWLIQDDPERSGGEFDISRFYKEIAIGVGAGIRLDFNFFVIRTDVAFPIRKPELPEGDRWTFDKLYFRDKEWRRENLIWNIAIGYPF